MSAESKKVLTEQLNNMASRLMEEGEKVLTQPLVVEYDNGGGQSGTRENPFFPAYEKLLQSYTKTLTAIKQLGGQDQPEPTSLESIRAMFKVAK